MVRRLRLLGSLVVFFAALLLFEHSAFANVPIGWAIIGGSALLHAGIFSKGIAFVAVFLIEFITLRFYFPISWGKAISLTFVVNLISTLLGFVITVPLVLPGFGFIIFLIAFGFIFSKIRAPRGFAVLAFLAVVIGAIGAFLNLGLQPPQPPVRIYVALILPLFLGFGLTLMIEGAVAKRLLQHVKLWKGVLLANVLSYLFLILMIPTFPNPYNKQFVYRPRLIRMIESGSGEAEIILVLHHLRAPTPFLLGLTDDDTPSERPYQPMRFELSLIDEYRESHPDLVQAIENDLEALKHLEAP